MKAFGRRTTAELPGQCCFVRSCQQLRTLRLSQSALCVPLPKLDDLKSSMRSTSVTGTVRTPRLMVFTRKAANAAVGHDA